MLGIQIVSVFFFNIFPFFCRPKEETHLDPDPGQGLVPDPGLDLAQTPEIAKDLPEINHQETRRTKKTGLLL